MESMLKVLSAVGDLLVTACATIGIIAAWAAAYLARENQRELDKVGKKVDYLAGKLYEVDGAGDVPAEHKERH